jgi:hypothetical protein
VGTRAQRAIANSLQSSLVGSPDDYRIEEGDQFVRVALHCRLEGSSDAQGLLGAVDAALTRSGFDRVMFDVRGVEGHIEAVSEGMWTWAIERALRAVAIVVDGEMTRVRTNMTALSRKVRLRAFLDEHEATVWMREPGRRTREIPQA